MVSGCVYAFIHAVAVTFFLSTGLYFEACTCRFRAIFAEINLFMNKKPTIESRLTLKTSLIEVIEAHNLVKMYHFPFLRSYETVFYSVECFSIFEKSREVMSITIFCEFLAGILIFALEYWLVEAVRKINGK